MKSKGPKPIDMTPLYRKYPGKFVALTHDRKKVVAARDTFTDALREAKELGVKNPIVERIPWEATSWRFVVNKIQFAYRRFPATPPGIQPAQYIYRPVIPVSLSIGKEAIESSALIDSGADECTFPGYVCSRPWDSKLKGESGGFFQGLAAACWRTGIPRSLR